MLRVIGKNTDIMKVIGCISVITVVQRSIVLMLSTNIQICIGTMTAKIITLIIPKFQVIRIG